MKKKITLDFIFDLRKAIEDQGFTMAGIQIKDRNTLALKFNGVVQYSGQKYFDTLTVTTDKITFEEYYRHDLIAPDGGLALMLDSTKSGFTHKIDRMAIKPIVDKIMETSARYEHDAKWYEAYDAFKKTGKHESWRRRFMRKYLDEHFPGEFKI